MAPYARWVLESFKHILVDSCDEYFDTNDRGNDKSRSKLITRVANDIAAIAQDKKEHVPDDLEKVNVYLLPTLNINVNISSVSAYGLVTMRVVMPKSEDRKSKVDTCGHPTSSKTWTAKSVSAHIFKDRISAEQRKLSDDGEKVIGKYCAALASVFNELTEAEVKNVKTLP